MRSDAQKRADKAYRERNKGKYSQFCTTMKKKDVDEINEYLKKNHISKAEFIRHAIKEKRIEK